MKPIAEQGYLIVAQNSNQVNYISCAETLAKTIKYWHPDAKICLLTNEQVGPDFLFDYVHRFPYPVSDNPYANDWQVFHATPFRETIKLEADMMITSFIDHWWNMLRNRDVVVSTGCRDWKNRVASARHYRKVFDENNLPDVYNAITYWRLSKTAQDFFNLVEKIFSNWSSYKTLLKFPEEVPSTDVVYAMAAQIIGPELVTLPAGLGPTIVHMKQHIISTHTGDWTKELVWENTDPGVRINTVAQWGFVHYHNKDWRLL